MGVTFFPSQNFLMICKAFNHVLIIAAALLLAQCATQQPETPTSGIAAVPAPTVLHGIPLVNLQAHEHTVKKNQLFSDLLQGYNITPAARQKLTALPKSVFDFRKIIPGKKYTVVATPDSFPTLRALAYETSATEYVVFHFTDSLWIEPCVRETITQTKTAAGTIESTLFETIQSLGISYELTNKLVDILAWQIDFQRLQKGDYFKLVYDETRVNNRVVGIGHIHGIFFRNANHDYFAIPFDQGEGVDYFDEQGKSLRKALLKYPIEFTRISSRYNPNRFHPVAKVFRPHMGTDFAAPTGTPIRSVGDGIVEEAQYKANNGNYVKIRHNGTYTTGYLHMSKIGSGIRPGARVRQGQTIGYVGSTGLATGPHLCYRFWKHGRQVDALRVELPPAQPIAAVFADEFQQARALVKRQLDLVALPAPQPEIVVAGN
jgi:murein DD-endopeptidase MepM/ murein hydrolase activator NlpD